MNEQAKIMSASLKRMSDMGAKNDEGMLEVLADDMGRYGLLKLINKNLINQVISYWTSYRSSVTCIGPRPSASVQYS